MKRFRGAMKSPRHVLAAATPHVPLGVPPEQCAVVPTHLSAWGNHQYGDCVTAEECFAKIADNPQVFISEDTCVRWARKHGVLEGAYLSEVLDWMSRDGITGEDGKVYKNGPKKSVDWTNKLILADAISRGPVKIAVSADQLEHAVNQTNGNGWYAGAFYSDDHTDHCVSLTGYGSISFLYGKLGLPAPVSVRPSEYGYLLFTWGTIGFINVPSLLAICREAWYRDPTTAGFPDPPPEPPRPPVSESQHLVASGYVAGILPVSISGTVSPNVGYGDLSNVYGCSAGPLGFSWLEALRLLRQYWPIIVQYTPYVLAVVRLLKAEKYKELVEWLVAVALAIANHQPPPPVPSV